ncbi:MAG: Ppx/GppA phosphatase family protein [Pseudomonadota bacterium]
MSAVESNALGADDNDALAGDSKSVIAAVDLGSNSFHMVVAALRHGQLTIIDRLRETVRLAEGLTRENGLAMAARDRALACLERFGERLRELDAAQVRAAGTNTLRLVSSDQGFRAMAERALGHPIEVIAGVEEARLIYLGVAHSLPPEAGKRLVIDIGGGSTEMIIGAGLTAETLQSLGMGCVGKTERFFGDGRLKSKSFVRARLAARLKLEPVKAAFIDRGWQHAIGASGTIRSVEKVALELGLIAPGEAVTKAVVEQLIERAVDCRTIGKLDLPGLSARRAQVWPGGLSILVEIMAALGIEALTTSDGALREGLLYDLVGRLQHEDARERSVRALAERYHVDEVQAERVRDTALALFERCENFSGLAPDFARRILGWAARLHEIGLDIAHADFHLHGAYVAGHADMPGFPAAEQQLLAYLLANQRKRPAEHASELNPDWRAPALWLVVLLRLAVLLNRSRSSAPLPVVGVRFGKRRLALTLVSDWREANPLTVADLERERGYLSNWNFKLEFDGD